MVDEFVQLCGLSLPVEHQRLPERSRLDHLAIKVTLAVVKRTHEE